MIDAFCNWLAATPLSLLFQTTGWVVPVVQSIHILCVAIVVATMSMLDLRLMGFAGRERTVSRMAADFLPWLTGAVMVLALTGIVLTIAEPARELLNVLFRLKMLLLAVAIAVTWSFRWALRRNVSEWDTTPPPPKARVIGLLSLALWMGIVICGRWIAYVQE